jgi:hypothetical protein
LLFLLLRSQQASPFKENEATMAPGTMLFWAAIFAVGVAGAVMRAAAGAALLARRSYAFALVTAAASVVIFCTPGGLIALPFGIWALLVLRDPHLKEAFGRAIQQPDSRVSPEVREPRERQRGAEFTDVRDQHARDERMSAEAVAHGGDSGVRAAGAVFDSVDTSPRPLVTPMASCDAEERERAAELAERPPGWHGLVALAIFGLGWFFVGAMWNFRASGLVIGFTALAAITYGVIRLHLVYLPKLRAELARQSAFRRVFAFAGGAALFALGMSFAFNTQLALWNLFDGIGQDWIRSAPSTASGTDAIARFSLNTVAPLRQVPPTELSVDFRASDYGSALTSTEAVVLVLFAFLGTACVFFAVHTVIDTRRYRGTFRNQVAPSLNITLALISTLPIALAIPMMPGVTWTDFSRREIRSTATSGELEKAVDTWAQQTGYTVREDKAWRIGDGKNVDIGQVRWLELWAPSAFDRRRVAGRFFVRPLPTLRIKCVSVNEPPESYVSVDLPMILKNSQEESLWPALLGSLEAAVKRPRAEHNAKADTNSQKRGPEEAHQVRPAPPLGDHTVVLSVLTRTGEPVLGAHARLIVGGYATDGQRSLPPPPENVLTADTRADGTAEFKHEGLSDGKQHVLYIEKPGYCQATRFFKTADLEARRLNVVLFDKKRVTLRYAFQPADSLKLAGEGLIAGTVTLYPMEGGSYRPPARAFFSFADNRRVGGSGTLKAAMPGIETDQVDGELYFGGSRGRFDHCTDLGPLDFDAVTEVDTDALARKREDTLIATGHVYIYESNIYEPQRRTDFTGRDVRYAKIAVERIDAANIPETLSFEPDTPRAGGTVRVSYRPGAEGLDGARAIEMYWNAFDDQGKPTTDRPSSSNAYEFPSEARGTAGGDFKLARKRCLAATMQFQAGGAWTCELVIPASTSTVAWIFVDDLGRTSPGGIRALSIAR